MAEYVRRRRPASDEEKQDRIERAIISFAESLARMQTESTNSSVAEIADELRKLFPDRKE